MPIRVIANTICLLKNPINGKICKIAFGNISWKQSYWHDCALFFVRVISKAITDQRRLENIFYIDQWEAWSQGSRKCIIGWELTKSGCHVQSQELPESHRFVVIKQIIPITVVFMHIFWGFRTIWLAICNPGSQFWLVDTYFWSYSSWLAKNGF